MRLEVKEQIKALLAQEDMTQKDLVAVLNSKGLKYSPASLSHRLSRGTVTYNEVMKIAEILGYDVQFVKSNVVN